MRYWDFFPPSSGGGWGRIPAFGFGEVVASERPDVEPDVRVYGYFPMSEHLVVSPDRVDGRGFFDGAAHRRPMASAYNHYLRTDADASYDPDREAQQMLLRPLFFTSYLVEDLLADNEDFGPFDDPAVERIEQDGDRHRSGAGGGRAESAGEHGASHSSRSSTT